MSEHLGKKIIAGSIWSILNRFALRSIGFINTIILARLLTPDDFGLIALSMLTVGLVVLLFNTDMGQAVLRRKEVNNALLNTAWTLRVIAGISLSVIIFLLAPVSAAYFNDSRILPVMQLIAFQPFIESLNNIGFVLYEKNLEFKKSFFRTLISKGLSVCVGVGIAIWLRNYWALAIGIIAQNVITTVMSFVMHPYRPRFQLTAARELATDSYNNIAKNIAIFLKQKSDEFFIGTISGANGLGGYYMAKSVANMLTAELIQPAGSALLSGYTRIVHDPERFKSSVIKVVNAISLIAFPCSLGLSAIACQFVPVVFGSKWEPIIPYFELFCFMGGLTALQSVTGPVLTAIGKLYVISFVAWLNLICFVTMLLSIAYTKDILLITHSLFMLSAIMTVLNYIVLIGYAKIGFMRIVFALFKPAVASIAMSYCLSLLNEKFLTQVSILNLVANVVAGFLIYATLIGLAWLIRRNPDSIEGVVFKKIFRINAGFPVKSL